MKKIMMLISLITIVAFNQTTIAANEDTSTAQTEVTNRNKATSNATIGFTKKTTANEELTDGESVSKPAGRLPTTGETLGMGASLLGLLLIIIIFRKDLKNMILNKKKFKGEKER